MTILQMKKTKNIISDKVEKSGKDISECAKKSKESELFDADNYFQLEYVDGEPLFRS